MWHSSPLVAASLPPVQVRLRLPRRRQRARPRVVPHPAHQQLLRRELGDDLAPVRRHHQLLLDTGRRPAIRRWPEGLQSEGHAFLNGLGGVQRDVPAEDWLLPDGEPHPVPVLQRKGRLLAGETKLLGAGPEAGHIRRGHSRLDHIDGLVQYLAGPLIRIALRRRGAADGQRPVVARSVTHVAVHDVEVGRVPRPQNAVREVVRMRDCTAPPRSR